MRNPWKALALCWVLALPGPALAQPTAPPASEPAAAPADPTTPAPPATPAASTAPAAREPVYELRPDPAAEDHGAKLAPAASAEPVATPAPRGRERPKLVGKPSGFWTSPRPARGGAYRYRMLGIGLALAALTGLLMMRVLRRHGARVTDASKPFALKPPTA
ncbi:MAG: hypothetical protein IPI49_18890 [Myxococcales bacterium]|nr:hypothetical protein [Myxococcales bacterium]